MEHVNLNDIWMSAVVNHCQFGSHIKNLKKAFMKTFDVSKVFLDEITMEVSLSNKNMWHCRGLPSRYIFMKKYCWK